MSVTPSSRAVVHARSGPYCLCSFDRAAAGTVAGWARDDAELFMLAPKTPPPLTAAKVIEWPGVEGCPLLLARDGHAGFLGYLELNPMPAQPGHLWMGHCVVAPEHRGQGLGTRMVALMLECAFAQRGAGRVSLVVFPENVPAVRCYRQVGFVDVGEQLKTFPSSSRRHRMLRMTIDRKRYHLLQHDPART